MKKTFKILGLIIFSILHMCNIGYSQTVVKDSITEFKVPLSSGTFVFNKQDGRIWQLNEKSAGTGTLATTSKREVTSKYALVDSVLQLRSDISDSIALLPAEWRSDISDSITAIHVRTFAEILDVSNNAGDTTITGLRGFGNGTIASGGLGIAKNGATISSIGIATNGGNVGSGSIGIATNSGILSNNSIGIVSASTFDKSRGVATDGSYAYGNTGLLLSIKDTIKPILGDNLFYTSISGYSNYIAKTVAGSFYKGILLASDTSNITNCNNFVGINLQNRTYEDLNNTTVIDRNLMLPGIDVAAQDSVLYIATDGNITKGLGYNGSQLLSQFNLSISTSAPSSATDTGIKGEIRITATHIYVCVDTDTWVRTELTTW